MTTAHQDDDLARRDWLAHEFERHRGHLRAVGYRMLGSVSEADDAVQEAWLRLDRNDPGGSDDFRGWLTVVVGRICLDALRSRKARNEQLAGSWLPEPIIRGADEAAPEGDMLMADSVGLALLVVLETLTPAERLAFVLHDVFGVPFDEIAPVVERSSAATRQLASRARRRVRARAPEPDADLAVQWQAVDAFLAAARDGDFEALLRVLDPNVVLRVDGGPNAPRPFAQRPILVPRRSRARRRGSGMSAPGSSRSSSMAHRGCWPGSRPGRSLGSSPWPRAELSRSTSSPTRRNSAGCLAADQDNETADRAGRVGTGPSRDGRPGVLPAGDPAPRAEDVAEGDPEGDRVIAAPMRPDQARAAGATPAVVGSVADGTKSGRHRRGPQQTEALRRRP